MTQARDAVFPEANVPSPSTPEWMRTQPADVRQVDFNSEYANRRRQVPSSQGSPSQPPPKSAPSGLGPSLDKERAELAEELRAVKAERAALEQQRATLEAQQEVVADAAAAITEAVDENRRNAVQDIAEIAVAVARALLEDALSEAPERAEALALAALRHVEGEGVKLRVGAALHIALLESGKDIAAELDPSLSPYGCIAENATTRVLGGLEERLGEVLAALKEVT